MLPKWWCFGKKTITLAPDSGWLPSVVQVSSINLFTKQEIYSARFWLACYTLLLVCLCCSKQEKKELLGFLSHFGSHRKNSTRHSIQLFFFIVQNITNLSSCYTQKAWMKFVTYTRKTLAFQWPLIREFYSPCFVNVKNTKCRNARTEIISFAS